MKQKQDIDKLVKKAILIRNLGTTVLILSMLLLIHVEWFPNAFDFSISEKSSIAQQDEITDYDPFFGLDSTEVRNGIHIVTGLAVDTGVAMVKGTCTACHSIDLVTQNKADRNGWKDIIIWMQETQGLWDLGESEDLIVNYLAKHYAPEDTGRRKNLKNIEWYEL